MTRDENQLARSPSIHPERVQRIVQFRLTQSSLVSFPSIDTNRTQLLIIGKGVRFSSAIRCPLSHANCPVRQTLRRERTKEESALSRQDVEMSAAICSQHVVTPMTSRHEHCRFQMSLMRAGSTTMSVDEQRPSFSSMWNHGNHASQGNSGALAKPTQVRQSRSTPHHSQRMTHI